MFGKRSNRRQNRGEQLDVELQDHIERLTEHYISTGVDPLEAARRARLEFGGAAVIKEECLDVHRWALVEGLGQDLKLAVRGIRKSPAFALMVIGTMALGLGVNTAMFSIIHSVFLRPLPYPNADRLVTVWEADPEQGVSKRPATGSSFVSWRSHGGDLFEQTGVIPMWTGASTIFNVVSADGVDRVPGVYMSSGMFRVLGVAPLRGRTFEGEDDQRSGRKNVVISHSYWQEHLGGSESVLGSTIDVDTFRGGKFTVVGVMPSGFEFPRGAKLWLSLGDWGGGPLPDSGTVEKGAPWYTVFARLKPGVTLDRVAAEAGAIARRVSSEHPEAARVTQVEVIPVRDLLVGEQGLSLWMLFGAVGCVLLIASANVANLLLSRGVGRRKELLTRMALGASRMRIASQLVVESLVLCALGGLAGVALAVQVQALLVRLTAAYLPTAPPPNSKLDQMVFAFAAILTLVTGVACGLAPLVEWRSLDWRSRGETEGSASKRFRHALVVSEVAVAVVLVAMAGLLMRTLGNLRSVDVGFPTPQLLTVSMDVTTGPLRGRGNAARFIEELLPRVSALPGVQLAGASTGALLEEADAAQAITRRDRVPVTATESPRVIQSAVTPDYFRVLGTRIQRGRGITEADTAESVLVAVINETAARRYWAGEDPVGKQFAIGSRERFGRFRAPAAPNEVEWREIVGVVSDVRSAGPAAQVQPEIYFGFKQFPLYSPTLTVRTQSQPKDLEAAIRREIAAVSNRAVVTKVRTVAEVAEETLREERLRATLVSVFSLFAVILGMLGIYGVLAYTVGQRTQEIGIRMALGADYTSVSRMIVGQALRMTATGLILGLAIAAGTGRWIASLLFGVRPFDVLTFAGTGALLVAVTVIASYGPARKATRVDPMLALRSE
jgi:putative ABC transport system permease protein